MPPVKQGFSLEDHEQVSTQLHTCRRQLEAILARVKARYSTTVIGPAITALERTLTHLGTATTVLRSELVSECTLRDEDGLALACQLYDV
jgi:hypothetical protein